MSDRNPPQKGAEPNIPAPEDPTIPDRMKQGRPANPAQTPRPDRDTNESTEVGGPTKPS